MDDDDDAPIEELCRPLSAKKMPKSQLYTSGHHPRTEAEARKQQRITSAFGPNWANATRAKKRRNQRENPDD